MAAGNVPLYAFNRGLISPLGLARTDLKRMALSAEVQTNWMPRVLGSMMLRPGTFFTGISSLGNAQPKYLPFEFGLYDLALLEFTPGNLRIIEIASASSGAVSESVLTRPAVSAAITNGTFSGSLAGWTNADQAGCLSQWAPSQMVLTGNGANYAIEYQEVTTGSPDIEHGIRIVVDQEAVTFQVGTGVGLDDLLQQTQLPPGVHSLSIVPGGNFWVQFSNASTTVVRVGGITIETAGPVVLPSPYQAADLPNIRWEQSADVMWLGCVTAPPGLPVRQVQRRGTAPNARSWSLVLFQPMDGPFRSENTGPVTLTPSGLSGEINLTASQPFFYTGHVGALFRLASVGATATDAAAGNGQFTQAIENADIGAGRTMTINIAGTFSGTVVLQRSIGAVGAWTDTGASWTAPVSATFNDNTDFNSSNVDYDNQIVYYRLGFDTGYGSGAANLTLSLQSASITGICRVTEVLSSTLATANVITQPGSNNSGALSQGSGVLTGLGSTASTSQWWEGMWSDHQGWPGAPGLFDGRLYVNGNDRITGSVAEGYASYDDTIQGDSGPILRTIGQGPVDVVNWTLPLQRLLVGTQGAEKSIRADSFDAPITPTQFTIKDASTQGSYPCPPVKIDLDGVFVQKSGRRIYRLHYSPSFFLVDYTATDLTNMVPDLAIPHGGFVMIAVQRQPDTRIHALMADGTVAVLIFDATEDEQGWVMVDMTASGGFVRDIVIQPGPLEDLVYYSVERTIGTNFYYLERWAREDECWGATVSKCADCHSTYQGAPIAVMTGMGYLGAGASVVVWADGADLGSGLTVDGSGNVALPGSYANVVCGLPYQAQFQSTKLAYAAQAGTALGQRKRIAELGLILANAHCQGLRYGPDFTRLRSLPLVASGAPVASDTVYGAFDQPAVAFPGEWNTDSRLCLLAAAPRPVTCLAAIIDMETRENL